MKEIKKQKQKTQIRIFGHEYAYIYKWLAYRRAYASHLYTYAYFKFTYAFKKHPHIDMPYNPS